MGNIKATFSAVDVYASDCSENYVAMINIANEIVSRIEKLLVEVQEDYETISKQIVRAQMMQDEVASKVTSYQNDMNSAYDEAQSWQAEIDYLYSNPDTVTTTDDDGNESTEEVYDYAAIHAAERKRDEAMQTYYYYSEKYEAAYEVYLETTNTISNFEKIKTAIHVVGESIQNDIYEIKKYISAIGDEAEYNTHALSGVIESLEAYLASKAIFLPAGAHYEDFDSSGSGGASVSSASAGGGDDSISIDTSKTIISVDAISVTGMSDSFELNDISLDLEDLSDTTSGIDSLPDKIEVQYKEISSANEYSDKKYAKQSQRVLQSLNWETQTAFREYSKEDSQESYKQINNFLRGKDPNFVSEAHKANVTKNIERMAQAIDNQMLPHNMKLYRGISSPSIVFGEGWEEKSLQELRSEYIGKVIIDKGFCSTSINKNAAGDFSRTREGTMIEITAPKGANGIFMEQVSFYKKEKEVLLQKGSGFKITAIDYDYYTGYTIKAQLVGRR